MTIFKIIFSLACLALGIQVGLVSAATKWLVVSLVVHSLPLGMQLMKSDVVKVWGVWLAAFLFAQYALSFSDFKKTLPHNMFLQREVMGDVTPGFNGVQRITTDEIGFRTTKAIDYYNKPENTVRIFAIGASTTVQMMLDDHKTWTHLLQQSLDNEWPAYNFEVINTGVNGLRAKHHLATFNEIMKYSPDIAIFLVGINDWNNHIRHGDAESVKWLGFELSLLGRTFKVIKASIVGQKENEVEKDYGERYSKKNDSLHREHQKNLAFNEVSSSYVEVMDEISQRCKEESIICIFLTQPTGYKEGVTEDLKRRFWMTPPKEDYTLSLEDMRKTATIYNDYLISFSQERSHQFCDVDLQVPPTTKYFYDDCHYNEAGAHKVGEVVTQCFRDQGIVEQYLK